MDLESELADLLGETDAAEEDDFSFLDKVLVDDAVSVADSDTMGRLSDADIYNLAGDVDRMLDLEDMHEKTDYQTLPSTSKASRAKPDRHDKSHGKKVSKKRKDAKKTKKERERKSSSSSIPSIDSLKAIAAKPARESAQAPWRNSKTRKPAVPPQTRKPRAVPPTVSMEAKTADATWNSGYPAFFPNMLEDEIQQPGKVSDGFNHAPFPSSGFAAREGDPQRIYESAWMNRPFSPVQYENTSLYHVPAGLFAEGLYEIPHAPVRTIETQTVCGVVPLSDQPLLGVRSSPNPPTCNNCRKSFCALCGKSAQDCPPTCSACKKPFARGTTCRFCEENAHRLHAARTSPHCAVHSPVPTRPNAEGAIASGNLTYRTNLAMAEKGPKSEHPGKTFSFRIRRRSSGHGQRKKTKAARHRNSDMNPRYHSNFNSESSTTSDVVQDSRAPARRNLSRELPPPRAVPVPTSWGYSGARLPPPFRPYPPIMEHRSWEPSYPEERRFFRFVIGLVPTSIQGTIKYRVDVLERGLPPFATRRSFLVAPCSSPTSV